MRIESRRSAIPAGSHAGNLLNDGNLLFQRFSDSNIVGIITADERNILSANDAFLRLIGHTRADLNAGRINWQRMTPREFAAVDQQQFRHIVRRGFCRPFEKEYFHKDGSRVPVLLGASRLTREPFTCVCFVLDLTARKQAEATILREQALLQAVLDHSPALISIKDLHGNVILANRNFAVLDAPPLHKLIGRNVFDIFPRQVARKLWNNDLAALKAGGPVEFEELVKHKDGRWHTYLTVKFPLRNGQGKPYGTCAISTDITERKSEEMAQQERAALFQQLFENAPFDFWMRDLNDVIVYRNKAVKKNWGELRGKRTTDSPVAPEVLALWQENNRRARAGHVVRGEFTVPLAGERRTFYNVVAPLRVHGKDQGLFGYNIDITARKQAEEDLRLLNATLEQRVTERTAALQASEEKFRRLFDTVPDAVLLIDGNSLQIVEANEAAAQLYGYRRRELLGKSALSVSAQRRLSERSLRQAAAGKPARHELRWHVKKDGSVFPVQISASAFDFQGRRLICRIARDMTRQMELEQEILAATEKERQRIAHDLHDDLCQQLTGIRYLTESLAGNLSPHSPADAAEAKKISSMIRHTLEQTRQLSHGLSPVDLEHEGLAHALTQFCARTATVFNCQCQFKASPKLAEPSHATAIHLYRITQEAVNNAIKHGKASRIDISLKASGNGLVLRVYDNGQGFPPRPAMHHGMGLSIMQRRADVLGGQLTVRKARRGGTEVICTARKTLPASTART